MRKKERERLRDFGRDESGKIAYLGDHVRLAEGHDRGRLLATLWASCGAAALAVVAASLVNPGGLTGCPYVVLPYMAQFVVLVWVVWGLGRLSVAGERVRVYVRDETVGALPLRCAAAAVLGIAAAVGEVVLLATSGAAPAPADLAFLACEAVAATALVVARRTCLATAWEAA